MHTVAQILQAKGSEVWSAAPETPVFDALQQMADKGAGALLVTRGERLAGIFSERDFAHGACKLGDSVCRATVADLMTPRVCVVDPGKTVEDCMALMTGKHVRHLPVLDGDKLVGVISIGDVVKSMMSVQEAMIGQLERYIMGG